jgi:hypothetical protein
VWSGAGAVRLGSWAADGSMIVGTESGDLWVLEPHAVQAASPADRGRLTVVRTVPQELGAVLSADGRQIAYASNESGRFEIYLQAVAPSSERRQISREGGSEPVWSRNGRELFYRSGDAIMAVTMAAGAPRVLFRGSYVFGDGVANYDVGPDGRFLMVRDASVAPTATALTIASSTVR